MDISGYSPELQTLIVNSVMEEIYASRRGVILLLPEAHKFVPQRYGSPAKRSLERLIREGGAIDNWVWMDSQDIAGVDKSVLKQCDNWLLGRQRELNEAEHAMRQVPLPAGRRPRVEAIMQLGLGQFYACYADNAHLVYVVPHPKVIGIEHPGAVEDYIAYALVLFEGDGLEVAHGLILSLAVPDRIALS